MRLVSIICLLALATAGSALAFAPTAITFQGQVTENGGGNVPDGHSLTFRIYDNANGGAPLYSTTENVDVQGGIFSVVLPIGLPFDEAYWIGVQYEAEAEMTPLVPFTSAPYAMNVDENAAVTSLNGNTGTVNLIAGANVSIVPSGNNFIIAATGAVTDDDWDVSGVDMTAIPIGNVGIGAPVPETKLHVVGDVTAGTNSQLGYFQAHTGQSNYPSIFGGNYEGHGGELLLRDEEGSTFGGYQPDIDGAGGFFWVNNGNFGMALMVDGDYSGTGSPRITMSGNNSTVVFDLEETEDLAVLLPSSSVSAAEMLDEPGLASINVHGNSSYSVQDSYAVVTSRSISVPTDGYLLAMCSLEMDLRHENGDASYVVAGLSLSPNTVDDNQDLTYYLPGSASSGIYLCPNTPTNVYPVLAGNHTVYLNARKVGTSTSYIWDVQLNLVFIPTSYGAVALASDVDQGDQETNQRVSQALSSGDIANEQRMSAQANEQRMQRELDQMRADFEALKQEVANSRNGNPIETSR